MQPDRRAPNVAQRNALVARLAGQDFLLDLVERAGQALGIVVDGVDHVLDQGRQQGRHRWDLAPLAQRLACRAHRVHRLTPIADQQSLGHGEMNEAERLVGLVAAADQIGEHAIDAAFLDMQLLMVVGTHEQLHRGGRKAGNGLWNLQRRMRRRQVEMQPQPAVQMVDDRLIDGQLFGRSVAVKAKGPHQARQQRAAGVRLSAGDDVARFLAAMVCPPNRRTGV